MGAGISKERKQAIVRRELHKLQAELEQAGVPTSYERGGLLRWASRTTPFRDFNVYFVFIGASNGECAGWPAASVFLTDSTEHFKAAPWMDKEHSYEAGIARIKRIFATTKPPVENEQVLS